MPFLRPGGSAYLDGRVRSDDDLVSRAAADGRQQRLGSLRAGWESIVLRYA